MYYIVCYSNDPKIFQKLKHFHRLAPLKTLQHFYLKRGVGYILKNGKPWGSSELTLKFDLPRTRALALSVGSRHYFTFSRCANGHDSPRRSSDGKCLVCVKERKRRWSRSEGGKKSHQKSSLKQRIKNKGKVNREFIPVEKFSDLPTSKNEAESLGVRRYFTGKHCKNGHLEYRDIKHGCRGCRREREKARRKTEKGRELKKRYLATPNAKVIKALQKKRRLERIKSDPVLLEAYRAGQRERKRMYRSTQSGKAFQRRRSFFRLEKVRIATPNWCDKDAISKFISSCPEGYHVDHIIPLRGKLVWGLNIPENLQYLPAQENISKSNKIDPLTLEAVVCVLPEYRSYKA